jgi:hypothetical protein
MKKIHFLTFTIFFTLSGCGIQNSGLNNNSLSYSTSQSLVPSEMITGDEKAIATRICYAYQSKALNFKNPSFNDKKNFLFNVTDKSCNNVFKSENVSAGIVLQNGQLKYIHNSSLKLLETVQTNETGFISKLCAKVQSNLDVSNTSVENGVTVQVKFYKDTMDNYKISYFAPNSKNQMSIISADVFKVRTQFNITAGQILGMDESYNRFVTCSNDPSKFSELSQVFVP